MIHRITEKHYSPWVKTRQDALESGGEGDVGVSD
jgi:hypothetical protein